MITIFDALSLDSPKAQEIEGNGGIEETLARVVQEQRMARVRELLARLTISEQVVMESLLGGLTAKAIAKKRGCTPQAVDTLRRRAVQKLKTWVNLESHESRVKIGSRGLESKSPESKSNLQPRSVMVVDPRRSDT